MNVKLPIILVNFKTYDQGTGSRALELAKICEKVAAEFNINITVAVQSVDICKIAEQCEVPVYAQHVDAVTPGSHTGHVLPEAIQEAGAKGTLINHAEKKIKMIYVMAAIERLKELKLESCTCAANPKISGAIATLQPTYVAFELPELIGTGKSISKMEPGLVKRSVELIKKDGPGVIPLCGAGVSSGEDVAASMELGAQGVLVASAIVKAKDQNKILVEMAKAATKGS